MRRVVVDFIQGLYCRTDLNGFWYGCCGMGCGVVSFREVVKDENGESHDMDYVISRLV